MGKTHEALERASEAYRNHQNNGMVNPAIVREPVRPTNHSKLPLLEEYNEIKNKLAPPYQQAPIKTIAFTSASAKGGATTSAVNFATALAFDNRLKILLVDGNFHSPIIHQLFNVDSSPGLTELLSGKELEIDFLHSNEHKNLYILPNGKGSQNSTTRFGSDEFDKLLKVLQGLFDYVIFDSPYVNRDAETKVLSNKCDGVILVIESGKTRGQAARRAKRELEVAGANVLGVILNRRKHYIPQWIYDRM